MNLITEFRALFSDVLRKSTVTQPKVDVGQATPIKQHPYRMNSQRAKLMEEEIKYMLQNGITEPSNSKWASPGVPSGWAKWNG